MRNKKCPWIYEQAPIIEKWIEKHTIGSNELFCLSRESHSYAVTISSLYHILLARRDSELVGSRDIAVLLAVVDALEIIENAIFRHEIDSLRLVLQYMHGCFSTMSVDLTKSIPCAIAHGITEEYRNRKEKIAVYCLGTINLVY